VRALVVYESMFGNTAAVARAVGAGLATQVTTEVVEVADAPLEVPAGVDLLVVGGPTHAFGLAREGTRRSAVVQGARPPHDTARGLREWLDEVHVGPRVCAAAFDTRIDHPRMPGTAAQGIRKKLHRRGVTLVVRPEHFLVRGTEGPLLDGEADRAKDWGAEVATSVTTAASG
jgi:hypothetical protein